jgi:hypothetical protein
VDAAAEVLFTRAVDDDVEPTLRERIASLEDELSIEFPLTPTKNEVHRLVVAAVARYRDACICDFVPVLVRRDVRAAMRDQRRAS